MRTTLFEVGFEVCNKVGGIHTVLATKARTVTEEQGDEYVAIGPWLLSEEPRSLPFEDEAGHEAFAESCRAMGLPVRVGRWTIPGRPRTVLVEFSSLYDEKDELLADLWERHGVDSIEGGWDYVEPVLFGHAAGRVIERWWEEYLAPRHRRAVAHFHEWMTGAGLLYLSRRCPVVGTVFTTHATMLGRALASLGESPNDEGFAEKVADEEPEEMARAHGVAAKHSLEGVCARVADVFTTVSEVTAREAELLHRRAPRPLLPNGIDLAVIDEVAGPAGREDVRPALLRLASRFLGEDVSDAVFVATSGRYEFHNKGIDLLLEAVARMEGHEGRRVVLFILVPAGTSGLRPEVRARLSTTDGGVPPGPLGISTHLLFDAENDPVQACCAELGLANAPGSRIKVVHVPVYLGANDDLLGLPYEALVRAMDLTAFPSFYEPWGYTPQESLALGVPTITSDYAGFGRWALSAGLGAADGVVVLRRVHREWQEVVDEAVLSLERFVREGASAAESAQACRRTAERTAWSDLYASYRAAHEAALAAVAARMARGAVASRRPKQRRSPAPVGRSPRLVPFEVEATLPEALSGLSELARNFWWSWDAGARALFEELDPDAWRACGHDPVSLLRRADRERLERAGSDPAYVAGLGRAVERLRALLARPAQGPAPLSTERPVAYFCAEFGIHESLPIYSGGLGILAGDHLKSASDLGVPLLGVGLLYRGGYLRQRLSVEGVQESVPAELDPRELGLERVTDPDGGPLVVQLALPGRELALAAWRAAVGRVTLFLLDSDLDENRPEDRAITRRLYGGDEEMRLLQELVLGRGGVRLLRRLGIVPGVWHLNEGHAGFGALERLRQLVRHGGLTFEEAREAVRASTVFTTHTPVPAGHDRFSHDLMRRYFSDVADWAGIGWEGFLALGHADGDASDFNMTYLALSFAGWVNGVSELHAEVSRGLLAPFWPGRLEAEVPVRSVTNGVHLATWCAPEIARLVAGDGRPPRPDDFRAAEGLDPEAVWSARRAAKARLVRVVRQRLTRAFVERDDSPVLLERVVAGLDERALFVGFARRFAPYKRAHLLLSDARRLAAILNHRERPVRVLMAGKAHPRDEHGKQILANLSRLARSDELAGRLVFVENHDAELARALVQGVDVWLNTPTRRQEASGTSGMKAAANGVLNLSIADGWWPEGADGENGWTIAGGRVYEDQGLQDEHDAVTLYRLLEEEVAPLFFERDGSGLPQRWLQRARRALATLPPFFNTDRMVAEYASKAYAPLARRGREVERDGYAAARARAARRRALARAFEAVTVRSVEVGDLAALKAGDAVEARVELDLGGMPVEDIAVELVLEAAANGRELTAVSLPRAGPVGGGVAVFEGGYVLERSGGYAYGLRVRAGDPRDDLVRWI